MNHHTRVGKTHDRAFTTPNHFNAIGSTYLPASGTQDAIFATHGTLSTWTNVSGDWTDAADWKGAGVPTSSISATIESAKGVSFTITISGTATASAVYLDDQNATLVDQGSLSVGGFFIDMAGVVTLDSGVTLNAGTLALGTSGAVLNVTGTQTDTLTGYLSEAGGTIVLNNTLALDGGGFIDSNVVGHGTFAFDDGVFQIGANYNAASNSTSVTIAFNGGTLVCESDFSAWAGQIVGGDGAILGAGTFSSYGIGTFATANATTISAGNSGVSTLTLSDQILWLNTGDATIVSGNGRTYLAVNSPDGDNNATIDNKGVFDLNGAYLTGAGTLTTEGTITITAGGAALGDQIVWQNGGSNDGTWIAGTVIDNGSIDFGGKDFSTKSGGTFVNMEGSVVDITDDGSMTYGAGAPATSNFVNYGVLNLANGLTETIAVGMDNLANGSMVGTIVINALANLDLAGGGTLSGDITGTGTLQLDGGNFLVASPLGGTATISNSLGVTLGGIDNDVDNTVSLTIGSGSTLELGNTITVGTGTTDLLGTSSSPSYFDSTASVTIDSVATLELGYNLTWTNTGTVTDAGIIDFGATANDIATFVNAVNAQFDFVASTSAIKDNTGSGAYVFDNEGTVNLSNDVTATIGVAFDDAQSGTINFGTSSVLDLTGGGTISATAFRHITGYGTLEIGGGILNVSTDLSLWDATLAIDGGTLAVAGAHGTTALSHSAFLFGGTGAASGISGGPDGGTFVTVGATTLEAGQENLAHVTWVNQGAMTLANGAVLATNDASTLETLVSTGSLLVAGNATGTIDATLIDTGTIDLGTASLLNLGDGGSLAGSVTGAGTLDLGGNFTIGGALSIGGATMNFAGGLANNSTVDIGGGSLTSSQTVTGTGTITIGAAGTLSLLDGSAAGQNLVFGTGTGGLLDLAFPSASIVAGTIQDFGGGNLIDLAGISSTDTLTFAGGVLTISQDAQAVASLNFAGSYTTGSFSLTSDNHGGSLLHFV